MKIVLENASEYSAVAAALQVNPISSLELGIEVSIIKLTLSLLEFYQISQFKVGYMLQ